MSGPDVLGDFKKRLQGMMGAAASSPSQTASSPWATAVQGHVKQSFIKIRELKVLIDEILKLPQYHPLMDIIANMEGIRQFCNLALHHQDEEEALDMLQKQLTQKQIVDPAKEIDQINRLAASKLELDSFMQPILDKLMTITIFSSYGQELAIFSAYADSVEGSGGGRSELSKITRLGDEALTFLWRYHAKDIVIQGDPSKRWSIDIQLTYALLGAYSHVNAMAALFEKIEKIIEGKYDPKCPPSPINPKVYELTGADFSPTPRGSARRRVVNVSDDAEISLRAMGKGVEEEAKVVFDMLELIYPCLTLLECPSNLTAKVGELKMRFFNIQQKFQDPIGYDKRKDVDIRGSRG